MGANTPLDACGGHRHSSYAYHYHAQVVDMTVPATATSPSQAYKAFVGGVYKCFKGDIESAEYFS